MSVELDLPDDLKMLREMVRRFVDQELIPLEGKSLNGADLKPDVEAKLVARCKELGLWQIDVPEDFGGCAQHFRLTNSVHEQGG